MRGVPVSETRRPGVKFRWNLRTTVPHELIHDGLVSVCSKHECLYTRLGLEGVVYGVVLLRWILTTSHSVGKESFVL